MKRLRILACEFVKNSGLEHLSNTFGERNKGKASIIHVPSTQTEAENENAFPLRPIASVRNAATEKVDWLASKILGQLVKLVPANIKDTRELINILNGVDTAGLNSNFTFISHDVVNFVS